MHEETSEVGYGDEGGGDLGNGVLLIKHLHFGVLQETRRRSYVIRN